MTRELDNTKALLSDYYARHSPSRGQPRIRSLERFTSGWASDVYAFTVEWVDSSISFAESRILKTYAPTKEGVEKALREWQALRNLRAVGYPVPGGKLVELDSHHLGYPFVVMEHISGQLLWHIFEQAGEHEREQLTQLFVRLLVDLHALDPAVLVPRVNLMAPYQFITSELAELRARDERHAHCALAPVVTWLDARKHTVPCSRPALLHCDYHPWNVLVNREGQPVVIDWDWQIGDARFDLAWTLTLLQRSGFADFCVAVQNEYERVHSRPIEELAYFEVLTSTRWLLNIVGSLKSGENLRQASHSAFRDFLVDPMRAAVELIRERTGAEVQLAI